MSRGVPGATITACACWPCFVPSPPSPRSSGATNPGKARASSGAPRVIQRPLHSSEKVARAMSQERPTAARRPWRTWSPARTAHGLERVTTTGVPTWRWTGGSAPSPSSTRCRIAPFCPNERPGDRMSLSPRVGEGETQRVNLTSKPDRLALAWGGFLSRCKSWHRG